MDLNISPAIWQSYINAVLNCLQSRKYCEAIMDDLLLFTPMKSAHFDKLEDLLKALHKSGLKISPKKCQLFKTDLQYMSNTIFSFVGMVNFVSIFCLELQKLLKPIYDLTRKGRQVIWGEEQQMAFDEIKHRLQRPPITDTDGSNYLQTPASLPLVVHCTKFRMDSQGSLPMPVKECQRQLRTIQLQS